MASSFSSLVTAFTNNCSYFSKNTMLFYLLVDFVTVRKAPKNLWIQCFKDSTQWFSRPDCHKHLCHYNFLLNWYLIVLEHVSSKVAGNVKWSIFPCWFWQLLECLTITRWKGIMIFWPNGKHESEKEKKTLKRILPFFKFRKQSKNCYFIYATKVQKFYLLLINYLVLLE